MNWNKDNPRFRRSSFLGSRRKKDSLFSRISRRVNGLFKGGEGKEAKSHRPHPAPPPELFEELKIALPKVKKSPIQAPSPTPDKTAQNAAVPGPASRAVERALENLVAEHRAEQNATSDQPPQTPPNNIGERPLRGSGGEGSANCALPNQKNKGAFVSARPPKRAEEVEADFKVNQLGRVRRRRVPPPGSERMEAGLGCDPKNIDSSADPLCLPPRRAVDGGTLKRDEEKKPPRPTAAPNLSALGDQKEAGPGETKAGAPSRKIGFQAESAPGSDEKAKKRPLSEAERKQIQRRFINLSIVSLLLVGLIIGAAAYFYLSRGTQRPVAKVTRLPQASLPKLAPIAPGFFEHQARALDEAIKTEVTIESGGSLGKALEAVGFGSRQGVASLISYMTKDDIVPVVQPGDIIRVFWADRGKTVPTRLEYLPNPKLTKASIVPLIIMRRADGSFWHYSPTASLLTLSAAREATIVSSLWAAGSKAGLDASIISSITEILASDIDFMTNIQPGDTFQVLYSRDYRDGQPKSEPIIDMIRLTNRGKSYEYYRYVSEGDKVSYFDPEGRSSLKAFFMTPLQYKRISSHFTLTRLHPIHKVVRPHQGVDYAAPSGTPVSTVADGTVVFCGWNGGYGKLVTIKHDETYTTMYAHLSKFASGISKGSKVRQGDLIGYVGATGTATGPHLDFRMKKHGKFIDPLPELAEQKGQELKQADKQLFIEKVLTPLRDEMTKKLRASRDS